MHRAKISTYLFIAILFTFAVFLVQKTASFSATLAPIDLNLSGVIFNPGDQGVLLGATTISPGTDTIEVDGPAYTLNPGDYLTPVAATDYFIDSADNIHEFFQSGFPVISSNDVELNSSDKVIIAGDLPHFALGPVTRNESNAYIDADLNGRPDQGEDFLGLVSVGSPYNAVSNFPVKTIPDNIYVTDGLAGGNVGNDFTDDNSGYGDPKNPTLILDANSDGFINEEDHVIRPGVSDISPLRPEDKVCFDASIGADAEYDRGEIIWWDDAGDCATFDVGTDVVLVGNTSPTGISTLFGNEKEVGMYSKLGSIGYACSRAGQCDALAYTGVDGLDWNDHDNFTLTTVFLTSSSLAGDGIRNTGQAWDVSNYTNWVMDQLNFVISGESQFVYEDLNNNDQLEGDEPILHMVFGGDHDTLSSGDIVTIFGESDHYIKINDGGHGFGANDSIIIDSANDILDPGSLDGTGVDSIVYTGPNITPLSPSYNFVQMIAPIGDFTRHYGYYDHDASGSLANGDDIVWDVDNNNVYNADDLQSIAFAATPDGANLDTVLTGIHVYKMAGDHCVGGGTDTKVGEITSGPINDQPIAITMDLIDASMSADNRTICIFGDIAINNAIGKSIKMYVPKNEAVFSGGTSDFSYEFDPSGGITEITDMDISISPGHIDSDSIITYTYTPQYSSSSAPDHLVLGVPPAFDITNSSVSCTDNGSPITGTSLISELSGLPVIALSSPNMPSGIVAGHNYTCVVANVHTPVVAGVYTGFVGIYIVDSNGGIASMAADANMSVAVTPQGAAVDGNNHNLPIINPPEFSVTVVSPNGGEYLKSGSAYPITWTASPEVSYVNIYYSVDGGANYTDIVNGVTNSGFYSWTPPNTPTENAIVKIESTDLHTVLKSDISDAPFTIIDSTKPYIRWRSPLANSVLAIDSMAWLLWDSSNLIKTVKLELSLDGGNTFLPKPIVTGNQGAEIVKIPGPDTNQAYIRITGIAAGFPDTVVTTGPITFGNVVDTAALHVTNPNTQVALMGGQKINLTWETTGDIPSVELQFSPDGAQWTVISPSIPNSGLFEWTVPNINSRYAFIRVAGTSRMGKIVYDRSDEPFWIIPRVQPEITLTSPTPNSGITRGAITNIVWTSIGDIPAINLYTILAGGIKNAIALGAGNVNFYNWTVPEIPLNTIGIAIEALDSNGTVVANDSVSPINVLGNIPEVLPPVIPEVPVEVPPIVAIDPLPNTITPTIDTIVPVDGRRILQPPSVPGSGADAAFDQSGLKLYADTIIPRITAANESIVYDFLKPITAVIGTNIKIELRTQAKTDFYYTTSDGRQVPFTKVSAGLFQAIVPIGVETKQVNIHGPDVKPMYSLSLRIVPTQPGTIAGPVTTKERRVSLYIGDALWNSALSGQSNPIPLADDSSFSWYVPTGLYTIRVTEGGNLVKEVSFQADNQVINPSIVLAENQAPIISTVSTPVAQFAQQVNGAVDAVRINPVAKVAANVSVPVAAVSAVASVAVLGNSFNLIGYVQYLFTSPLLFAKRRKRKSFGVVYNALTKMPIGLTTIRFYDQLNNLAKTVITDVNGRYAVVLPVGEYRPVVIKLGYKFPSEVVTSAEDAVYTNVYSGGYIAISGENQILNINFAIDPHDIAKVPVKVSLQRFWMIAQRFLAPLGFVVAIYAAVINTNTLTSSLAAIQAFVLLVSIGLTRVHLPKSGGKILDETGAPVGGAVVRLFDSKYNKLIETQRTDARGGYAFTVGAGLYYMTAEAKNLSVKSKVIDLSRAKEPTIIAQVLRQS